MIPVSFACTALGYKHLSNKNKILLLCVNQAGHFSLFWRYDVLFTQLGIHPRTFCRQRKWFPVKLWTDLLKQIATGGAVIVLITTSTNNCGFICWDFPAIVEQGTQLGWRCVVQPVQTIFLYLLDLYMGHLFCRSCTGCQSASGYNSKCRLSLLKPCMMTWGQAKGRTASSLLYPPGPPG